MCVWRAGGLLGCINPKPKTNTKRVCHKQSGQQATPWDLQTHPLLCVFGVHHFQPLTTRVHCRDMNTKRTVVVGDDRRYVESVPRGLLVVLAHGSGELRVLVQASPRRHRVLTPVLLRSRRRQKDIGPASAVARLACGLLWAVVVIFSQ
jgi:hypothetical protein